MNALNNTALRAVVDRVYVINLASRPDRRREMAAELERIGLHADDPDVEFFAAIKPDSADTFPSIGARGCFLSHLGVLRDASEKGLQGIMILEDDAAFTADYGTQLEAALTSLKTSDWAIAYLGHRITTPSELGSAVTAHETHWHVLPDQVGVETTHAMLIHERAIKPLIAYLERMIARPSGHPEGGPMHVDGAYSWFRRDHPDLPTFITPKQYVVQRASKSDIAPPTWKDKLPFLPALRQLKNYLSQRH